MLEGQTITPAAMLALLPLASRADIEATIELLIAELDVRDGDTDLEDDTADCCTAGDDGCGIRTLGRGLTWGAENEDSDEEDDGLQARRPHIWRIRRTRCDHHPRRFPEWQLRA